MITLLIIIVLLFAVTAWTVWHRLGDPVQAPEQQRMDEALIHKQRVDELRRAYEIAKEELGEEPTIDQVFLTRDSLRTQDRLGEVNGTT